jgi:hypothetical protein
MLGSCGLLELAEVRHVGNAVAAGTSTQTLTSIDMKGYDAITVICDLGTVTDASVLTLKLQTGALSNGSDAADVTGATTGAKTAATSSNTILAVDLIRPSGRYVTPVLTRATQNAAINCFVALLYRTSSSVPLTQGSTVLGSKVQVG